MTMTRAGEIAELFDYPISYPLSAVGVPDSGDIQRPRRGVPVREDGGVRRHAAGSVVWLRQRRGAGTAGHTENTGNTENEARAWPGRSRPDTFRSRVSRVFRALTTRVLGTVPKAQRAESPEIRAAGLDRRIAMTTQEIAIVHNAGSFSHNDAARIFDLAVNGTKARTVVIDLKRARDATTSAFAELVRLRRALLRVGRDLRLVGLHDRTAHLYGINRLEAVLPCA